MREISIVDGLIVIGIGISLVGGYKYYRNWKTKSLPSPEDLEVEQIRKRIKLGSDLDSPNSSKGKTLLHRASKEGFCKAIATLLNASATVDLRDHKGQTALHKACAGEKIDCIQQLIQQGASLEARDDQGRTPLMLLMQSGYNGEIDFLIPKSNLNDPNRAGDTHLHLAVSAANPNWIQSLLAAGADPKAIDGKGQRVLERLFRGQLPFTRFVAQYFADRFRNERKEHLKEVTEDLERLNPKVRRLIDGKVTEIAAKALAGVKKVLAGRIIAIAAPEECKKALKSVRKDPYFSLKYKSWYSEESIVLMGAALIKIKKGLTKSKISDPTKDIAPCVRPLLKDREDCQLAFQLACEFGQKTLAIDLLYDSRVEPNQPSPKNVVPLHAAIRSSQDGDFEFAKKLIASKKFDLKKAVDRNRDTVAHAAAEMGSKELLELLGKGGAPLHEPNKKGVTPLQRALEKRYEAATRFLIGKMDDAQLRSMKIGKLSLLEYAVVHAPTGLRDALNERGIFFNLKDANSKLLQQELKEIWRHDLTLVKEKGLLNLKEINQLIEELQEDETAEPSELYSKLMLGIEFYLKQADMEDKYKAQGKHPKKSEWIPLPFGDYLQMRRGFGEFGSENILRYSALYHLSNLCKMGQEVLSKEHNFATAVELGFFGGKGLVYEHNTNDSIFQVKVNKQLRDLKHL